jgi:acyl-coenzyme A thioesterase PaaI-like protein
VAGSDHHAPGVTRKGPFWEVLEGRRDPPAAAVLLGWRLVSVDPEAETIEVAFTATERFLNPAGDVQGGFLAAMLDDTLGPANGRRRSISRFSS